MKSKRAAPMVWPLALLATALGAVAPLVQAQTAERPLWKVGHKWSYHYHKVSNSQPDESDWSREVVQALPDGTFSIRMQNGNRLIFDGETNSLDKRGPEYSWKRFSFPLSVGKQWKYDRRIGDAPRNGYETASWQVKAYEKITVPAGTFDCFRVEGVIWRTTANPPYPPYKTQEDVTYWYCPAVKWVAKWKSHFGSEWTPYVDGESVLTSFAVDE